MGGPAREADPKQVNRYSNDKRKTQKGGTICSIGTTSQNALTECVRMGRRIVVTNATTESVTDAVLGAVTKCAGENTSSNGFGEKKSDHRGKESLWPHTIISTLLYHTERRTQMKTEKIRVRLTFIDSILGGEPNSSELHEDYIQSKIPDDIYTEEEKAAIKEEEIAALLEGDEKGKTVFYRNEDGEPCLKNNHIKGFFKSACAALKTDSDNLSHKMTSYKKEIDTHVFVFSDSNDRSNRFIPIQNYGEIGSCQRPLRAQTMQGERVAIADSEEIQAGAFIEFDVITLAHNKKPLGNDIVKEWLDFGMYNGLGQWRNAGHGAFQYEVISEQ